MASFRKIDKPFKIHGPGVLKSKYLITIGATNCFVLSYVCEKTHQSTVLRHSVISINLYFTKWFGSFVFMLIVSTSVFYHWSLSDKIKILISNNIVLFMNCLSCNSTKSKRRYLFFIQTVDIPNNYVVTLFTPYLSSPCVQTQLNGSSIDLKMYDK